MCFGSRFEIRIPSTAISVPSSSRTDRAPSPSTSIRATGLSSRISPPWSVTKSAIAWARRFEPPSQIAQPNGSIDPATMTG